MQKKKNKSSKDFDFASYRQKVIEGLIKGQPLTGESGLLKTLIAEFVQGTLDAELEDHLAEERKEREELSCFGTIDTYPRTGLELLKPLTAKIL